MYAAAFVINALLVLYALIGGVLFNCALHYGPLMWSAAFIFAGLYMFNFGLRLYWWAAPGALVLVSLPIWLIW